MQNKKLSSAVEWNSRKRAALYVLLHGLLCLKYANDMCGCMACYVKGEQCLHAGLPPGLGMQSTCMSTPASLLTKQHRQHNHWLSPRVLQNNPETTILANPWQHAHATHMTLCEAHSDHSAAQIAAIWGFNQGGQSLVSSPVCGPCTASAAGMPHDSVSKPTPRLHRQPSVTAGVEMPCLSNACWVGSQLQVLAWHHQQCQLQLGSCLQHMVGDSGKSDAHLHCVPPCNEPKLTSTTVTSY